jgi:hypothetical protein
MTKLEKLYSIIENSRDVGVKLDKGELQQVEELDFIINYDIKYRMGDELNDNE